MVEATIDGVRIRRTIGTVSAVVLCVAGCTVTGGGPMGEDQQDRVLPWEWWRDLATIASVAPGDRVVMRSSYCPTGCERDRHSEGDSRFLEHRGNGEGVIFAVEGAGAVTRIWMVMGDGVSESLDSGIRLRIRIDGRRRPVVDLPLPKLFDGSVKPFTPPLVSGRETSGGGYVSYVPVAFADGCEISLVGAEKARIWYQVVARLVDDPTGVRPFTGRENFDGLRRVLAKAGTNPWPGSNGDIASGTFRLAPGDAEVVAELSGPDMVNGIIIRTPRKHWPRLGLRLTFDDREPQLIPVLDLVGRPDVEGGVARSLLVGGDEEGDLYCYFPMPFHRSAKIELMRRPIEGPRYLKAEIAVRTAGAPPPENAGHFRIAARTEKRSEPGRALQLFDADGAGKLVGLIADLRPAEGKTWRFLEGDEMFFFGAETEPSWHGTGVEDFFNGGFYFRRADGQPTPFSGPLAGAPLIDHRSTKAVMYRLLLGDALPFTDGLRGELETGPQGETSVSGRVVAFLYSKPGAGESEDELVDQ